MHLVFLNVHNQSTNQQKVCIRNSQDNKQMHKKHFRRKVLAMYGISCYFLELVWRLVQSEEKLESQFISLLFTPTRRKNKRVFNLLEFLTVTQSCNTKTHTVSLCDCLLISFQPPSSFYKNA